MVEEKAQPKKKIICPKCGEKARYTKTQYGLRNACCDLWSWGDAPLVDAETHSARQKAHEAFDLLWQSENLTRSQAYQKLQDAMGLPAGKCHIKQFNYDQAFEVLIAVDVIWETILKGKS